MPSIDALRRDWSANPSADFLAGIAVTLALAAGGRA
jgi:hypothetical protein